MHMLNSNIYTANQAILHAKCHIKFLKNTMFVCWEVKESGLERIISTGESETILCSPVM